MASLWLPIAFGILSCASADPFVIWNTKLTTRSKQLSNVLPIPTVEKPLVVFVKEMFDLGELSRAGDVYSTNSNGGKLSYLKSWMTSSKGYSVIYGVEDPMEQIIESVEPKVDSTMVARVSESELEGFIPSKFAILYVAIPKNIERLDKIAETFKGILNSKDYTAVLFGKASDTVQRLVKREVKESTSELASDSINATWVNNTNILFYSRNIYFVVRDSESTKSQPSYNNVSLDALNYEFSNETDNVTLTLSCRFDPCNLRSPDGKITLNKLKLSLTFHIIGRGQSSSSAWELQNGQIDAIYTNGKDKRDEPIHADLCSATKIETEGPFSYSCKAPSIFWATTVNSNKPYSCSMNSSNPIGIKFKDLQVQPYYVNGRGRFSEASDCVGFFSIGIWMGLFAMVVMLLIFAFGIIMISDLKTQNRFDDPRGKPLQINVKE